MNKIIIVSSGEIGDIIIKVYKDAGYKIKKPKHKKVKIKVGNGILDNIKQEFKY